MSSYCIQGTVLGVTKGSGRITQQMTAADSAPRPLPGAPRGLVMKLHSVWHSEPLVWFESAFAATCRAAVRSPRRSPGPQPHRGWGSLPRFALTLPSAQVPLPFLLKSCLFSFSSKGVSCTGEASPTAHKAARAQCLLPRQHCGPFLEAATARGHAAHLSCCLHLSVCLEECPYLYH